MKSQRLSGFLVVLLLMLSGKSFSQQQLPRIAQNSPHIFKFSPLEGKYGFYNSHISEHFMFIQEGILYKFIPSGLQGKAPGIIEIVKPDFTVCNLPFFCKKELQIERATYIPLHFRLGSLEYVNRMEGKDKVILLSQ